MTKPMDHIAYLSQEIGARPAGTEEEQQAALYIADQLRSDAHLEAEIEDFTCLTSANLPKALCGVFSAVLAVLAMAVPQMLIPALIGSLIALALLVCEIIDKPVLSRLFMKGVSQNGELRLGQSASRVLAFVGQTHCTVQNRSLVRHGPATCPVGSACIRVRLCQR